MRTSTLKSIPSFRISLLWTLFAILQPLCPSFSLIFPQFHGKRGGTDSLGEREMERETEGERQRERERWWKARSNTGKLIFFFWTLLLLTASGTEYKLINLPGYTCYDTQGKSEIRYGSLAEIQSRQRSSQKKQYLRLHEKYFFTSNEIILIQYSNFTVYMDTKESDLMK